MVIWLIDISQYQTGLDVGRAVAEGYSAVWMKATEGVTWRDKAFDTFAEQVLASGAIPGAYHFLREGYGRAQCDVFYQRMRDHGGPDGWLAACDNEQDAGWQTTVDFFARWRELAGDHPLFMYSGNWWWSERGWYGASLTPYLWDSRYVSGSGYGAALYGQVPESWWSARYGGWGDVTVLQFTSSGSVAGRTVDVNAFRGSIEELRALAGIRMEDTMALTEQQQQVVVEGTSLVARMAKGFDTLDDGTTPNELYRMIRDLAQRPAVALSAEQLTAIGAAAAAAVEQGAGGVADRLVAVEGDLAELRARVEQLIESRIAAAGAESGALAP